MEATGEFELIARIAERVGAPRRPEVVVGPGDDAAVTGCDGAAVTSVDAVVDGVHFRRDSAPLRSIGVKALSSALSDIAAMGAATHHALVVLGVPDDLDADGCLEIYEGIAAVATETGTELVGGDVTAAPALTIAITAVGAVPSPGDAVRRGGGRPGDVLAVTGELGGAAAGLALIERPEIAGSIDVATADVLRSRQLEPAPRLDAGRALAEAGASAMIDISDGLGADCGHLAKASGWAAAIQLARVPVAPGVEAVADAAGLDPLTLAASGGEDYELLAALSPDVLESAEAAVARTGSTLTGIGELRDGQGVELRDASGAIREAAGFDQLRSRRLSA